MAGTVGWERSLHGWVIMYDEEGERVVYDVELEMAYRYQRGLMDTDLYAMYPADTEWWHYVIRRTVRMSFDSPVFLFFSSRRY